MASRWKAGPGSGFWRRYSRSRRQSRAGGALGERVPADTPEQFNLARRYAIALRTSVLLLGFVPILLGSALLAVQQSGGGWLLTLATLTLFLTLPALLNGPIWRNGGLIRQGERLTYLGLWGTRSILLKDVQRVRVFPIIPWGHPCPSLCALTYSGGRACLWWIGTEGHFLDEAQLALEPLVQDLCDRQGVEVGRPSRIYLGRKVGTSRWTRMLWWMLALLPISVWFVALVGTLDWTLQLS